MRLILTGRGFEVKTALTKAEPSRLLLYLARDRGGVRAEKILGSLFSLPLAAVAHRSGAAPSFMRVLHRLQVLLGERLSCWVLVDAGGSGVRVSST